ncbi:MAG: glycosyltransferase [Bacteroidia bacterium]|nr:glycosyltransferase [Bacteroidia bacterium]MCX7651283.1 glycosyltransferase [Bacteroidia bacterium]MDW8416231.1 glycosyltransferase [Bacteroidia bacterium]
MKALYLTYDGLLDPLGQSQILPYIYGLVERLGVEFSIVSFEKRERLSDLEELRAALSTKSIQWYPLSFTRKPPVLAKAWDSYRFFATAEKVLLEHKVSLFHARSYVAGWVAHRLSQRYGIPWIFDMRGFWADERRETRAWPAHHPLYNWLYRVWKRRERFMLHSAAHIIVLTEAAKATLNSWQIPSHKITVIPCVADYEHFTPHPETRKECRKQLRIPSEAFVLGYVGSLGPLYELAEMIRFFKVLLKHKPDSYLVFFTPSAPEIVYTAVREANIPFEKIRIRSLKRAEVPLWSSILDASIIFCLPGFSRIGSSPTRVAEMLAMNIPVIMQADLGDTKQLARDIEGIYACPTLSEESYELIVHQLLLLRERGEVYSPRHTSQAFLALPVGIQRYEAVYRLLCRTATSEACKVNDYTYQQSN